jgi:H+/Cl- antiporter ClcA
MATETPAMDGRAYLRIVGIAAAIGIPAALAAAGFLELVHRIERWLWDDLPDALGQSSPPWYLVIGLPVAGALIVALARRLLPGDGGHAPLLGLVSTPTPVAYAPGVILAAIGTLGFGAVLGPEAPVIALGSVVGTAVVPLFRLDERGTALVSGAGSFSAVSALFGGPIVAGILLLEAGVGLGAAITAALLPGLVAAAVGYVLFVGIGDVGGLPTTGLTLPDMPSYGTTDLRDLLLAVAVGVATALAIAAVRLVATRVDGQRARLGMVPLLVVGGLAVGLFALVADALGADPNDVLFSGQTAIPAVIGEASAGAVLVLLVAKALGYAVSLGCGFRGGPIFPAVFLGVAFASFPVVWFDSSPTWAVAVGAAAGMAAQTRFVVSPLLFGTLLVGTAGLDVAPAAVLAVAAAWLTMTAVTARAEPATAAPAG